MKITDVNILDRNYEIYIDDLNNKDLANADGICYTYDKKIYIREEKYMAGVADEARRERFMEVVRHELIHAIAKETGVSYDDDEQLVDWIAMMLPNLNKYTDEILSVVDKIGEE